jgi:hypothetical protein
MNSFQTQLTCLAKTTPFPRTKKKRFFNDTREMTIITFIMDLEILTSQEDRNRNRKIDAEIEK